ncbi:MAG: hypothetical protein L0220_32645 [Acidobacteria bacterium]|nr:hypothetical protein [Acidobacteriota bacterium]
MIEHTTRQSIVRLASSRIVALEKSLKSEVGSVAADWAARGMPISSGRVVDIKAAGDRNLIKRAELITNAIIEVCESRSMGRRPNLGLDLQTLFDEIYGEQLTSVRDYIEGAVPEDAKKLCPIGEIRPEIQMHREELLMSAERLPLKDHWANIVLWFRSRWWSVPIVVFMVCLPLLVQWIEMVKAILKWLFP